MEEKFILTLIHCITLIISAKATGEKFPSDDQREKSELRGPRLEEEPEARIGFSNSSGTELRCKADGIPTPTIWWQARDGARATDVAGLRYQRPDGSLVFPPFQRAEYRQDVHDAVYQCIASNEIGTVMSREVHIKGVVQQKFSPQVYDGYVIRGNTAVLRCHLPSFVREYVELEAWIRNDGEALIFKANENKDDSYSMLPTGELLLYRVQDREALGSFRCRVKHRLTGEIVTSASAGKIVVTEPHSPMAPRISFSMSQIRGMEGSKVQMPCVSQAQPAPIYRWVKETLTGLIPVTDDNRRVRVISGTLEINDVRLSDGGKYQCIVKNLMGEKRTDTVLLVTVPLHAAVIPKSQTFNIGESAVLNCTVSGHPVVTITWKKDSLPLTSNSRVQLMSREVLHISSIRRDDQGMYQCFAWNEVDSAQGTAELRIGDVPPYLLSAFPDTVVYPGEPVSLKCVSSGNSIPVVTWSLDGEPISYRVPRIRFGDAVSSQGHVSSYLNISEARTEDSGEYKCHVQNDVGSVWHSARLNVYGPLFVRSFRNTSAVSGTDLTLKCPFGGYPIQSITWKKGGINLPLDHRQKTSTPGILTIQNVQRAADKGEYTCIARSPDGHVASGSTNVSVVVAPVIDAQLFPDTLTASDGARTKILCSVPIGDPPVSLRWLKNGFPFLGTGQVTIQRLEDSSILLFRKVKASDRGKYTCVATNAAASTNMTTNFIVNVPPSWTSEPLNTSVVLGNGVSLNCSAEGYPSPSIVWRKARDSNPGDFGYVHSSSRLRQFNNGTLVLWNVDVSDGGFYLCQANNGIGAALSKIIFLDVKIPPRFEETYQSRAIKDREAVSLKCSAIGNTPIVITWQRDKKTLPVKHGSRYSFRETSGEGRASSELVISPATRQDSGLYTCAAKNDYGSDEATRHLVVQGVPDPPTNLTVTNVSSRSISLKWEVPFNGNSQITGSSVQYKIVTESWKGHTSQLIVSGADSIATIRSLQPVTSYQVRIIVENAIGKSRPSSIINTTTDIEAPSGPPRELTVHPTGDQSLKVSWKPPRQDTRHGPIQGYHVGYRNNADTFSVNYQFKQVDNLHDDEQQSTYLTGLQPFTSYDVVVRAFNSAGPGPISDSIVATTLETAPPTSPILQVISTTMDSVDIRWEKDSKDKSIITEYTLHYKPEDGTWLTKKLSSSTDRSTLSGLKCGTRYQMYLTASNSLGTGEPSVSVPVRTKGAAPMPAPQKSFVTPNMTIATLHLDRWQSAGCSIQFFTVQYRLPYESKWRRWSDKIPSHERQTVLTPLLPGREYYLMVTAHSEAGVTQADYKFRTMPISVIETTTLYSGYPRDIELPFHRNVSLIIPVVVSSLVLIIVLFTLVICLRKYSTNDRGIPHQGTDVDSQKTIGDSLIMTEITHQKGCKTPTVNGSHYSSPSRGQQHRTTPKSTEHRRTEKQHEYAEPYIAIPSARQRSDEGGFATIKRAPTRSGSVTSAYKQGFS